MYSHVPSRLVNKGENEAGVMNEDCDSQPSSNWVALGVAGNRTQVAGLSRQL